MLQLKEWITISLNAQSVTFSTVCYTEYMVFDLFMPFHGCNCNSIEHMVFQFFVSFKVCNCNDIEYLSFHSFQYYFTPVVVMKLNTWSVTFPIYPNRCVVAMGSNACAVRQRDKP